MRPRIPAAFNFTHAPPVDGRGISVLLIAGDDAAFAADALRHVEVEAVLLSFSERAVGDEGGYDGCRSGLGEHLQREAHEGVVTSGHCEFVQW